MKSAAAATTRRSCAGNVDRAEPNPASSSLAAKADPHGAGRPARVVPAWRPFKRAAFESLAAGGQTILIDFTADWCLTCKTLEAFVLDTRKTRE